MRTKLGLAAGCAVFALAAPASATTLLQMSFEEIVADAEVVVVGEAIDQRVVRDADGVRTITTFRVSDAIVGGGETVEVTTEGGSYSTGKVRVREALPDAPVFLMGAEQLLFLDAAAGQLGVVGFNQGARAVASTDKGRAVRLPGDEAAVSIDEARARIRAAKANPQGRARGLERVSE